VKSLFYAEKPSAAHESRASDKGNYRAKSIKFRSAIFKRRAMDILFFSEKLRKSEIIL